MMINFYVYFYIRGKDSPRGPAGSPYYVGKGRNRRAFEKHILAKRPSDRNRIILWMTNLTEEDAHLEEMRLISIYGRIDNNTGWLHNRTDGGEGNSGTLFSAERRAKIGKAHKGREWTEMHLENLRASAAKRRKPKLMLTPEQRLENHRKAFKAAGLGIPGKPLSPEHRANISAALKNKVRSAEHCAAISAAKLGTKLTPENRAKKIEILRPYWLKKGQNKCVSKKER